MLTEAYRTHDHGAALAAYRDSSTTPRDAEPEPRPRTWAARSIRPSPSSPTPGAGRLLFGDKGRPELGTGVLERLMREMNRRTDVGVRWSVEGVRAILMVKLGRKYHHGWCLLKEAAADQPKVRVQPCCLRHGVNTSPRYQILQG